MTTRRSSLRKTERVFWTLAVASAIALYALLRNAQALFGLHPDI